MQGNNEQERAPEPVERFVKALLVAYKAVKLYPPASDIPRESAGDALRLLRALMRERPDLRFQVFKEGLLYNALPVLPDQRPFGTFARELYNRHLSEVRFHAGVTDKELIDFLRVLQEPPEAIAASGGFEQRLWDLQVDGVTVREISAKIVDTELTDESTIVVEGEDWPPTHERIDEIIEAAYGARPRDQRLLVRFVQNPGLVSRYLNELASTGRGGRPLVNLIAGRVVSLAHTAFSELAEEQPELFRSIAEGLLGLDADLRRDVLTERLLPDARLDEAVAGVLRQLELGELCSALVEGLTPDPVSRDGLSRAIRNLAVIAMQPKEEVLAAAGAAMQQAGAEQSTINAVLENAAPAQIRVRRTEDERNESVESVLRLIDLAPVADESQDDDVVALREEARAGITDGDVLLSIVTLVTLERRPDMFASLMSLVEDGLGLMLEWGEYDAAADSAAALNTLEQDDTLEEGQQERIRAALVDMADPRYMREVSAAMRIHRPGTPEHESCRRLLSMLGGHTIGPLLEVLADEPDMAARKALVDLISGIAANHIDQLGDRVADGRWYFVRKVVSILGSTKAPETLPHLNRTLRHFDARVRRETIRAIAGIRTRYAEELLVAALADDDSQNVGLAARYLGSASAGGALAALAAVARGEGRGNREPGARIEAIEALGRLGGSQAAAVLADIARQRGRLMGGRAREVRAAAEAALAQMRQPRREVPDA
jgi:hypothetical protein